MNQKLKDLKEKIRTIDEKVEAGEAVRINLSKDGEFTEPLVINENKSGSLENLASKSRVEYPIREGERWFGDISPEPEDFNIDCSEINLTDEDIDEIVRDAPQDVVMKSTGKSELPIVNVAYDVPSKKWILTSDCVYKTDNGWEITVKKDFDFDLASVPRPLWILISSFDLSLIAPLYHDLLYRHGGLLPDELLSPVKNPTYRFSREEADDILYELMKKAQVPWWRRQAAYRAVRTFSGFAWKG